MPNPIQEINERFLVLEARVATLETRVETVEQQLGIVQALQVQWSPPYRFPLPPINP